MSELRTARDLTVPGHVEEARSALHRAIDFGGVAERAAWAERWGESAVTIASDFQPGDLGAADDLEELEGDVERAKTRLDDACGHLKAVERLLSGERSDREMAAAEEKLAAAIDELEAISL